MNATLEAVNGVTLPDHTGRHAQIVKAKLGELGRALTVAELQAETGLSERLVRLALDRLLWSKELVVDYRHTKGRRGSVPRVYALAPNA